MSYQLHVIQTSPPDSNFKRQKKYDLGYCIRNPMRRFHQNRRVTKPWKPGVQTQNPPQENPAHIVLIPPCTTKSHPRAIVEWFPYLTSPHSRRIRCIRAHRALLPCRSCRNSLPRLALYRCQQHWLCLQHITLTSFDAAPRCGSGQIDLFRYGGGPAARRPKG